MDMVKVKDKVKISIDVTYPEGIGGQEGIVTRVEETNGTVNPVIVEFENGIKTSFAFHELTVVKPSYKVDTLVIQIEQWSINKGLDLAEPTKQYLKVAEEFGEIGAALARGNEADFKDAVGDTVVTLIILAQQKGYTLEECLRVAYDEIKGRQGVMKDGVFVKAEDLEGEPNADKQKL